MSTEFIDMGEATDVFVTLKPGTHDAILINGVASDGTRWVRVVTSGAAQVLWFRLAHILFPRAAEQITHRTSTAVLRKADAPTITSTFEVLEDEGVLNGELTIQVVGIGGLEEWCIQITPETGKELWASLEKTLHMGGAAQLTTR